MKHTNQLRLPWARLETDMRRLLPHPATIRLLQFQATAKLSRTLSRFRGTRRLGLSILAILLAMIWLGQVGAALFLREPADPAKLSVWIPMGLLAYTLWHLVRAACRTPIEPFEWTPAEQELLGGAPLARHELVMYRLAAIGIAATAKAFCFALVMMPDLQIWLAGFFGMLMALLFVDLARMLMEIAVYGMSRQEFLRFRIGVLGIAAAVFAMVLIKSFPLPESVSQSQLPSSLAIGLNILSQLLDLRTTAVGALAARPFEFFGDVILAQQVSGLLLADVLVVTVMILALGAAVIGLDAWFYRRRVARERVCFQQLQNRGSSSSTTSFGRRSELRVPPRVAGAATLAWRQTLGAFHYRTSLCVAMIVPGVLSCLTLFAPHRGAIMLFQIVGGLVFYSFLLLPTAFKFDFRRDVDRLGVLKSLPISPTAVTLGQLAVPVTLCTLFQLLVLLVAMAVRPFHPGLLLAAVAILIPTNCLIFSLENLIFLLYPYRLNQEGLGVFFRSILTFTGKGILFAVGLAVALLWGFAAQHAVTFFLPGSGNAMRGFIFTAGLGLLITACAAGTTAMLINVYRRFDPSQDTPAA